MNKTHGLSGVKLYKAWGRMRRRCFNTHEINYKDYGGRGIMMCKEWDDFTNFYNWAINNGYQEGLTVDRIDNDGNYCPDNCRFSTFVEQVNNRRNSVKIDYNGEVYTIAQLSQKLGIRPRTLYKRRIDGLDLAMPLNKNKGVKNNA